MDATALLHAGTIALTVGLPSLSVGIGEGIVSAAALQAINEQPAARADITKAMILGCALIETAAILAVAIGMFLLFGSSATSVTFEQSIAELGIAAALAIPGCAVGFAGAFPARAAINAIARQPFFTDKIIRFMLITQTLIQTPIIFGFLVAMFIRMQLHNVSSIADAMPLFAAGLCIGIGTIGPACGLSLFARAACAGLGINRHAYDRLFSFAIISQAIIETPIFFALVVALLILVLHGSSASVVAMASVIAAAICIGLGTIGPGMSSGATAAAACTQIAHKPELYNALSRISMLGQGIIDACAVYALLIALILLIFS